MKNNKVQCKICPRNCILANGQKGYCYVRENINNTITLTSYGYNTGLAVDPVEKKPLYHFYPGTAVLSFGTLGCNMGCKFCQNWHITKVKTDIHSLNKTSPEELVKIAKHYDCKSIAFTYNDPVIFFEYAIDTAKLCQVNGIKTIAVTSGYINPEPAAKFFKYMDAANIDLKSFSEEFYKKNCSAHIQPVLDTIKYVKKETKCWLELTTLLIPDENDSNEEIKSACEWILNNLGEDIPLHFSAFFPKYKFSGRKHTNFSVLLKAYETALNNGLKYVYTGNLTTKETSSTYCKNCGGTLIARNGYKISEYNIKEGKCIFCGCQCDGKFE